MVLLCTFSKVAHTTLVQVHKKGPILLLAIVSLDLAPPVIDLVVVILMSLEEKATPVGVGYSGNNNSSGGSY